MFPQGPRSHLFEMQISKEAEPNFPVHLAPINKTISCELLIRIK